MSYRLVNRIALCWLLCAPLGAHAQGPLTNGANHEGSIRNRGETHSWYFTAKAGDSVSLSIGEVKEVTAPFFPSMRLSNGSKELWATGDQASQITFTAVTTGTYTVQVSSLTFTNNSNGLGTYRLTSANTPGPTAVTSGDDGGVLANASTVNGSTGLGDLDVFTFEARAGEALSVSIAEVQGTATYWPWIRLRRPDGVELGHAAGDVTAQINAVAPTAGTYTVVVGSGTLNNNYTGGGSYRLTLASSSQPLSISAGDEGGALTNGANHNGTITLADLDVWSFQANAGDTLAVSVGETRETAPYFEPWIRLRGPTGAQLVSSLGDKVAQINATAPLTGTYTIVVASSRASGYINGTGDYRLTLGQSPRAFTTSAGDQGGPLTRGGTDNGVIPLGDLDFWSFEANAGEMLTLAIKETRETATLFYPWLRLRGPNGAQLGSSYAPVNTELAVRAPSTGTYTLLVGTTTLAGYIAGTGEYQLTSSRGGLSYSALGDSYSSGEGVLPYSDTGNLLGGCHRSLLAYPRLVRMPGTPEPIAARANVKFDFYACSGAVARNVSAFGEGQYGEPPQLAAVNQVDESRDLVTISIGGNDGQFMPLVEYCLIHNHCHDLKPFDPHSSTRIGDLYPLWVAVVKARLRNLYAELRSKTPNAAIIVLGYPILMSGNECGAVQVPGYPDSKLSADEQVFLRSANVQLNTAIASVTTEMGLHFVPMANRFVGHEICSGANSWINGLVPLNPTASFHPTARGQQEFAQAVNEYLEARRTGWGAGYLPSGAPRNPAPRPAAAAPPVTAPEITRGGATLTSLPADCNSPGQKVVPGQPATLRGAGFAPNETLTLSLTLANAATLPLGTATANASGALDATVTIPASAPIGANGTLEASGAGPAGAGALVISLVTVVASADDACRSE